MTANLGAFMPPDHCCLIHGDYKLDNIIFDKRSSKVLAVIDWEMSTLGHFGADLANLCAMYTVPRMPPHIFGLAGMLDEYPALPHRDDLISVYANEVGRLLHPSDPGAAAAAATRRLNDVQAHWHFFEAFWYFKYAVILHGVMARAAKKTASYTDAGQLHMFLPWLVDQALMNINALAAKGSADTQPATQSRL